MTVAPEALFHQVQHRPGAVWLDGGTDRRSLIAWDPCEVVQVARDWPAAARALGGRVIGYVGYGAGPAVEAVPMSPPSPEPEVWLGRFDGYVEWMAGRWRVHGSGSFRDEAETLIRTAPPPPPPRSTVDVSFHTCSKESYERRVQHIQELLRAGDCYQVNLTRAVTATPAIDPWDAYRRIRAASAARFGAFLRPAVDVVVASNSPELLLSVRGGRLRSEPIKGTRPRSADPTRDEALARELSASEKDRAELTMIVDLVRNDLGKIARTGTIRTGPRTLTSHQHVHHMSQRVEAELGRGDGWDALAALFPPGSVTGAPKVRATERIRELEDGPRGAYCGAIGTSDERGDATWSVAIRTAIWAGGMARYHVGGGITVGSDPEAEWYETEDKGRAWAEAMAGRP